MSSHPDASVLMLQSLRPYFFCFLGRVTSYSPAEPGLRCLGRAERMEQGNARGGWETEAKKGKSPSSGCILVIHFNAFCILRDWYHFNDRFL